MGRGFSISLFIMGGLLVSLAFFTSLSPGMGMYNQMMLTGLVLTLNLMWVPFPHQFLSRVFIVSQNTALLALFCIAPSDHVYKLPVFLTFFTSTILGYLCMQMLYNRNMAQNVPRGTSGASHE